MWVFCAGMRRAGSTLQYQVASHLVEEVELGVRLPWSPASEFSEIRERHAGSDEWLVLKSHECTQEMAEELRERRARGFSTVRDLRDVVASQMVMLGAGFEELWSAGFIRECVEQHAAWAAQPGMATMRYEAMVEDPAAHVRWIAEHLEVPITDSEAEAVAAEYSPESQRARIEAVDRDSWQRVPADDRELLFDPHTLLHHNHFGGGRPGAWSEMLSPDESLRVEEAFGEWLLAHEYRIS